MAIEVVVPRLGWSMDEGRFVEWLKQDGEHVHAGDMLFVLEGDKSAQDIESFDAGILRIPPDAPQPGDEVEVGQLLAFLVEVGEMAPFELGTPKMESRVTESLPSVAETTASQPSVASQRVQSAPTGRVAISPRARRVARELAVDCEEINGSGRGGRIREKDIREAAAKAKRPSVEESGKTVPVTRLRRTIAERMMAGVHTAAPVTLTTKFDATNLVSKREKLQSTHDGQAAPTLTDIILKQVSIAIGEHPAITAQWRGDGLFIPDTIHIAFAVDTDRGLIAPVIHNVVEKNLTRIARESRALVDAARNGQLKSDQVHGGVFTITNLGALGIDTFTPIINLPQSAILGVGRIVREPAVVGEQIVARDMMTLSLTFDHRAIDGAPTARFLQRVSELLSEIE